MSHAALKEEIHALVNKIHNKELLNVVLVLLKPHDSAEFEFTEEEIEEFDKRMADRKNGVGKSYTLEQAESYFRNK